MFTEVLMLFFYCETPLHAGSGEGVSYVDLPIQREKHTDYPIIQSSGVKGAFRDWGEDALKIKNFGDKDLINKVFGPEPKEGESSEHGGTLSFTDAQTILFPVRSFKGGFAWIICPNVINRFSRFLKMIGIAEKFEVIDSPQEGTAWISDGCALEINNQKIILEDFAFKAEKKESSKIKELANWLSKNAFPKDFFKDENLLSIYISNHLAILSDDCFKDFVKLSTQIITRIRIGESGTVEGGALWTQELLMTDTLLYCLALAKDMESPEKGKFGAKKAINYLKELINTSHILQIGGDETLGRGLVKVRYLNGNLYISKKEISHG